MLLTMQNLALLAAFGSALSFSTASVAFTRFSREISSAWMNVVKAGVCWIAVSLVLLLSARTALPPAPSLGAFLGSGALGLGIGDLFLLAAFARIGASRTLMVFGFQPLLIGVASAALFGQSIGGARWIAIGFFMACLFLVSFERYRRDGHWELRGLAFALTGVVLDNTGVLLTRWGFDLDPATDPMTANWIRTSGALLVFFTWSFVRPINVRRGFAALAPRARGLAVLASLGGTFLSLSLYMFAVKNGHLASISAIVLSGPVLAATVESITQKKPPSRFLLGALVCLFAGMGVVFLVAPMAGSP